MTSNRTTPAIKTTGLERALQVNIALLTALGAVLLGTGQMGTHNLLMALMAVFAAVSSAIFTDALAWFRLNRTLANLAAIMAVGFSLTDFFGNDAEYQLLAVANLLIYLQIVLLYQTKNERVYWQLLILSLLQVVVSAALNLGVQFGILIVIYMFAAFSAMALFFFHRESLRFVRGGGAAVGQPATLREAGPSPPRQARGPALAAPPARRTLAFRFTGNLAQTLGHRHIARHVVSMGLMTLLFTVVFFFALPRVSDSVWQGPRGMAQRVVGFSQEVTLDNMGKMLQSNEEVLRVSYLDQQTGEPVRIGGGPYIRGTVLVNYIYGRGRWRQSQSTQHYRGETMARPRSWQGVVRQEIVLQQQREPVLFATFPVCDVEGTRIQVKIDAETRQLFRDDFDRNPRGTYRYALGTSAFRDGLQMPVHPAGRYYYEDEKHRMARFRPDLFPRLTRIANEVVAAAGVSDTDVYGKARALEEHFHLAGRYNYSLSQLGVEHRQDIDPVEDFVANHRTGHCEYFASALVLMLRSQGIPARMAVGFRATEYNSLGNFYQVRDKDAHAWVEAYLRKHQIPAELRDQASFTSDGAWVRLEPTPLMVETDTEDREATVWDSVLEWKNYTKGLWSDYVLGLNAEMQRTAIYAPLLRQMSAGLNALRNPRTWKNLAAEAMSLSKTFAWPGAAAALVLLSVVAWRSRRRRQRAGRPPLSLTKRLAGWWRARGGPAARGPRVRIDFYERLETLLARYGMRRSAYQTQREFAGTVAGQLRDGPAGKQAARLPRRIVEAFYQVRFGQRDLSAEATEEIEDALTGLNQALAGRTTGDENRSAPE